MGFTDSGVNTDLNEEQQDSRRITKKGTTNMQNRNFARSLALRLKQFAGSRRKGAVLVLAAFLMVMVFGFATFGIDVGYLSLARNQMQTAADAAALAGASELSGTLAPAEVAANVREAAVAAAAANRAADQSSVFIRNSDITLGNRSWNSASQTYQTKWGDAFTPYNLVKVNVSRTENANMDPGMRTAADHGLPLFFAPIFGQTTANMKVDAVATFQPRDVVLVLDFSGSMNDDSEFKSINTLGRTAVENNQYQIYQDLGAPVYGNKLTFTPQFAKASGVPASGNIPHIDVTYKGTSVDVVSTKTLTSAVLKFSNNNTQTFNSLSGTSRTLTGSGSNAGKVITYAWVKSGTNASLDSTGYGEKFDFTTTGLKTHLGLANVAYPYSGTTWDDFITYNSASSGQVYNAGYRWKFGYLTWINYLLESKESYAETPDLWKTSEQPIRALKDGVDLFLTYLQNVEAEDKVGFVAYTYSESVGAKLESSLTDDLELIRTLKTQRQAGHYNSYTNIGAGMAKGRAELVANARPKAFRMMVLMTDGLPNKPTNESTGTALVLSEAQLAAQNNIRILAVSVGAGADSSLMQQVADITGGIHFNVPGGQSVAAYTAQLQEVFRTVASSRPLKLISGE